MLPTYDYGVPVEILQKDVSSSVPLTKHDEVIGKQGERHFVRHRSPDGELELKIPGPGNRRTTRNNPSALQSRDRISATRIRGHFDQNFDFQS
jgi:hypothetical protein